MGDSRLNVEFCQLYLGAKFDLVQHGIQAAIEVWLAGGPGEPDETGQPVPRYAPDEHSHAKLVKLIEHCFSLRLGTRGARRRVRRLLDGQ